MNYGKLREILGMNKLFLREMCQLFGKKIPSKLSIEQIDQITWKFGSPPFVGQMNNKGGKWFV